MKINRENRQSRYSSFKHSSGQAMTETLITAVLVLVPLLLLIPLLGKYIDIKHATIQSARYQAWEYTVWYSSDDERDAPLSSAERSTGFVDGNGNSLDNISKTTAQTQIESRRRFFSETDTPITNGDKTGDWNKDERNRLWTDHRGESLVLDNFGDDIDFHVNYIANENSDGSFSSLHGQPEVDENIRELCAMKYYPDSYMNYVWCRNKDIKGDYTNCAADFQKIKTCASSNEGKKLLSQNIKLTNELGIGASPTWMVNNKYKFNGIDAETVKTNFCKYNDVAGCDNALSGQPVGSGSAPSAAGSCN